MKSEHPIMPIPRTIRVESGPELSRLLDEADETPIVLEKDGARYCVTRVVLPVEADDIWAGYDGDRSLARLQSAAGGWSGLVDAETFKAYIAERRRTANRPYVKR
jgi:hypothetical protein